MAKMTDERREELKALLVSIDTPLTWWAAGEKCYYFLLGTACLGEKHCLKPCDGMIEPDADWEALGCDPDDIPQVVDVFAESESQCGGQLFELMCALPELLEYIDAQTAELEATINLLDWYEDDNDTVNYDGDDLPDELIDLHHALEKVKHNG